MYEYLEELKRFRMIWNVTITPYDKDIEPNVPDKNKVMDTFRKFSESLGSKAMIWRYDPIFLSEKYDMSFHLETFEKMSAYLNGYTDKVVISFIDLYLKTRRNFPEVNEVSRDDQITIVKQFSKIASDHGMRLLLCHEDESLKEYGADISGCLSKKIVEDAINEKLIIPHKLNTRQGCSCLLGNDIGEYNTCMHLCRYCYANYDSRIVMDNYAKHDPDSPLLIGHIEKDDQIRQNDQKSFIDHQLSLF